MGINKQDPIWVCDGCKKQIQSKSKPNSMNDPWGYFNVEQDAGWDYTGSPWAPRMREKALLCGDCIEKIMKVYLNLTTKGEHE